MIFYKSKHAGPRWMVLILSGKIKIIKLCHQFRRRFSLHGSSKNVGFKNIYPGSKNDWNYHQSKGLGPAFGL